MSYSVANLNVIVRRATLQKLLSYELQRRKLKCNSTPRNAKYHYLADSEHFRKFSILLSHPQNPSPGKWNIFDIFHRLCHVFFQICSKA